ncbi:MAG: hypothetical protein R2834_03945 [Rhodothermales bacterium]
MDKSDREADLFQFRRGDLLVCEGGEVGRAALWDSIIANRIYWKAHHRLRPKNDQITNKFMVQWIMFAFFSNHTHTVTNTRTAIAYLPIKLKPLLIPIPSPAEQVDFLKALGIVDQNLGGNQGKLGALRYLFRAPLIELLTARIRVHKI